MIKFKLFGLVILFLAACSKNPYEAYPGFWERQDENRKEVIEIKQADGIFLLNTTVLKDKHDNSNSHNFSALAKVDGQLSFNNGLSNIFLVLSESDTLIVGKDKYKRISSNRLDEIKAELAKLEQERIATQQRAIEVREQERLAQQESMRQRNLEREKCQALLDKINIEIAGIKQFSANNAKWTAEYEKIKQKYTEIAKQYVNCKPDFF